MVRRAEQFPVAAAVGFVNTVIEQAGIWVTDWRIAPSPPGSLLLRSLQQWHISCRNVGLDILKISTWRRSMQPRKCAIET